MAHHAHGERERTTVSTGYSSGRSSKNRLSDSVTGCRIEISTRFIKETISNADDFGVTWPAQWDNAVKSVLLGAVFLIDFIYFESRGQR